jgi:hypothetical protein
MKPCAELEDADSADTVANPYSTKRLLTSAEWCTILRPRRGYRQAAAQNMGFQKLQLKQTNWRVEL